LAPSCSRSQTCTQPRPADRGRRRRDLWLTHHDNRDSPW
jgi:hypothetical protein